MRMFAKVGEPLRETHPAPPNTSQHRCVRLDALQPLCYQEEGLGFLGNHIVGPELAASSMKIEQRQKYGCLVTLEPSDQAPPQSPPLVKSFLV